MLDSLLLGLPVLLVDILNPVLFAALILALATSTPMRSAFALLAGHTLTYWLAGILLVLGLGEFVSSGMQAVSNRIAEPQRIDFVIEAALGALILWMVLGKRAKKAREQEQNLVSDVSFIHAFGFGVGLNLIGLPFALPYIAYAAQLLKAELSAPQLFTILTTYNLAYAVPFLSVPLIWLLNKQHSEAILAAMQDKIDKLASFILPVIGFVLGVVMLGDASYSLYKLLFV